MVRAIIFIFISSFLSLGETGTVGLLKKPLACHPERFGFAQHRLREGSRLV